MLRPLIRAGSIAALVLIAGVSLAAALVRWPIHDPNLRRAFLHELAASTGLKVRAEGRLTFRLLPRPTLRLGAVTIGENDDAIRVDADFLSARLSPTALAAGRITLSVTLLDRPTIGLDIDRLLPMVRAAAQGDGHVSALPALLQTGGLVLRDGVIRLRSADPRRDSTLTEVSAAWHWPADGAADLHGHAVWRGNRGDFVAFVDAPLAALAGTPSNAYLRVRSDPLDLTVTGAVGRDRLDVTGGHVTASTRDLPGFLRLAGTPFPALDGITEAHLSGDWTLPEGLLDLRNARLELDDMLFEGGIAFHQKDGHPGLSGTLATDRVDLAPFLRPLPGPTATDGRWSSAMLETKALAYDDIDLRISASRAGLGPLAFDDAGLSLQSGNGRLEFSLGEARSDEGLIKGRIIAQVRNEQTEVRAEANVSQINLGMLSRRLGFGPVLTGTSTGRLIVEAVGESPQALVDSANGEAELSIRDGTFRPALAASAAGPRLRAGVDDPLPSNPFDFDAAAMQLRIAQGSAEIEKGAFASADGSYALRGTISLRDQALDCTASPVPTDTGVRPGSGTHLFGPWAALRLDHAASDAAVEP